MQLVYLIKFKKTKKNWFVLIFLNLRANVFGQMRVRNENLFNMATDKFYW